MTKALIAKSKNTIHKFQKEHPFEYVNGVVFHHYGFDYRIEEIQRIDELEENRFNIYRVCESDVFDTWVGTIIL